MKTLTKQSAFNKIWNHFVVNNKPPGYDYNLNACVYRNKEGNRCSIGLLLSDEEINKIELQSLTDVEFLGVNLCLEELLETSIGDKFEDKESYFWLNLQEAHDFSIVRDKKQNGNFNTSMKNWLEKTATEYRLTIPE